MVIVEVFLFFNSTGSFVLVSYFMTPASSTKVTVFVMKDGSRTQSPKSKADL